MMIVTRYVLLTDCHTLSDLSMALSVILPTSGAAMYKRWLYGDILCIATNYIESFLATASILLLCALNISKLTSLLFPFRARTRTKRTGYRIAGFIWILSFLPIIPDFVFHRKVAFNINVFRCDAADLKHVDKWLDPIKSTILVFVPLGIISISTIWLIFFVRKVRGLQKQSVVTSILISLVFMASFVPFGIILVLGDNFDIQNSFHMGCYKVAVLAPFLNFMANPLIYLASIASFREFVAQRLLNVKGWSDVRDNLSVRELSISRVSSNNVLSSLRRAYTLRQSSVVSTDNMLKTDV